MRFEYKMVPIRECLTAFAEEPPAPMTNKASISGRMRKLLDEGWVWRETVDHGERNWAVFERQVEGDRSPLMED